ncbi:response regulator [Chamaesiphon sp. VAR_48_metabat_135_sub]|uniref:response regulator n=1 Tax=Chamaesiphon sp. VAR_48_metabat_135_sub TaxID=2964699 RepID=UPI00286BB1E9|nr:response regulator [Chamaesiphon sp. VAR_48_metabat_135_sub]
MKILVVEDDLLVAEALRITLSDRTYAVEVAHDGRSGLDFIEAFDYDLLLLDVILPNLDGISICRHVRSRGYMMPILLLTSKDSKHDRAIGLDAGADDYVIKPFDPEELSARIRALLRRGNDRMQPVLTWEDLTLDPRNYEVTYQHQLLNLTPKEYSLLELFLRHNRQLFSCGAILEHLWTYEDAPSEEAVRTHIKGLRHKLKAAGAPTNLVETVYGIGYRLKPNDPIVSRSSIAADPQIEIVPVELPIESTTTRSQTATATNSLHFLTDIWNRHYAQILDRVASIDLVINALEDRSLTTEIRHQAWQSAHTLAGTLGTFGLSLGSQIAKQIESLLDANSELTPAQIPELKSGVKLLRQEIASKTAPVETTIVTPPNSPSPQLLVVTSEPNLASSLRSANPGKFEIVSATELSLGQLAQTPQLIILDLDCFPQIADGLAVLSELERDYPQIPTIVLSQPNPPANINGEGAIRLHQRIKLANSGAKLSLSKPLAAGQILLAVDRVLQQARASQARVTIVDDDRLLLESVSALLSLQGMTVTTLSDPSRFWETLEASAPDLLILDLDMPTHDGIELCRAVRTDPQWASLPILFLTAHSASIASDRVFAAGADDFVTKPVIDSTLVTRIVNRLERIGLVLSG